MNVSHYAVILLFLRALRVKCLELCVAGPPVKKPLLEHHLCECALNINGTLICHCCCKHLKANFTKFTANSRIFAMSQLFYTLTPGLSSLPFLHAPDTAHILNAKAGVHSPCHSALLITHGLFTARFIDFWSGCDFSACAILYVTLNLSVNPGGGENPMHMSINMQLQVSLS